MPHTLTHTQVTQGLSMRGTKPFSPSRERERAFLEETVQSNAEDRVLLMDEPNGVCGNLIKSGKFVINQERNERGVRGKEEGGLQRKERKKN